MKKITIKIISAAFLILVSSVELFAQTIYGTPNNICAPANETFVVNGTINAYRIEWNFGDGSPVIYDTIPFSSPVTHQYNSPGYYNVFVNTFGTTNNYLGSINSNSIQVNGISIYSTDSACLNDMISFCPAGQVNTAFWDFGDGTTSNQACVEHAFTTTGLHIVTLTTTGGQCGNQTIQKNIYITTTAHPHPNIWTSSNSNCPAVPVAFKTNTYSTYLWNFGDTGSNNTSTLQNPEHTYSTPGNYIATLTVTNNCGFSGTSYPQTVTIVNNPPFPTQNFNLTNSSPACPNSNINFNAPGGYNSYQWNFGDSSPSVTINNNSNTNHTYSNTTPGNYTVTVKITSACGNDTTISSVVNIVNNAPWPTNYGFNLQNGSPACPNSWVGFQAPGGFNSYEWHFGDGSATVTTNNNNNSHLYTNTIPANYTVTVKITNSCGNDTTLSSVVHIVNNAPWNNYNFNLQTSSPSCPNSWVGFNAPGGYNSYEWHFGDLSPIETTNNSNNSHHYTTTSPANYTAYVKITNGCGHDTIITTTIHIINNAPWPNYSGFNIQNPSSACPNSNVGFQAPCGYNSYVWNFGDGSPAVTTNNCNNTHTYGNVLNYYTVSVKITNGCGADTTLLSSVHIINNAPWPNQNQNGFSMYVNSPSCPNSNVGFNAPQGYNHYVWNFGDGSPLVTTNNNNANHIYGNSFTTYQVSVKITSACGNDTTLHSVLVISNNAPFPNQSQWFKLEANPNPACPSDNVNFNAPGGYTNYLWSFGDSSPAVSTSQNYSHHIYSTGGNFTATVKITNGCGQDTTISTVVHIQSTGGFPNQSWFQLNVNSPSCPNSSVGFQAPGGYSNYVWNFGDNSPLVTSNNNNYQHTYGSAIQNYTVSVKVTNGCGNDTTLYAILHIKNDVGFPSEQWFKIDGGPNPSCPGDQVNFNAPNGYSNYKWMFGNGDSASSSQSYANHVYTATGTYTYHVTITNACGNDTTLYGTIVVGGTGSFYSGLSIETNPNTSACANDLIHFKLNHNGFNSYFWNFGDGNTVTTNGQDIQHSFNNLGTYTVSCKVKNGCGDSTIIYTTVQVTNNSPVSGDLSFNGIPNPSCPGDEVFFVLHNGQSTTKYFWDFGDGSPADTTIGVGSSHIYTSVGAKTVTLLAKNACGMTKTVTATQIVSTTNIPSLVGQDGKPMWGYPGGEGNNTTAGCAGDAIVFYFMGNATNNIWDFGDGNQGTATEHIIVSGGDGAFPVTIIKHVFANNGPYTISLTLFNNCGNSVTDSMSINIGGNQVVNGELSTSPPPYTTCAPINFIAFGGANYAWNFGDGATLSSPSPTASHTFATQGVYVVTVLVTNGCGNTATYSLSVNVNGAGGPAITVSSLLSPTCVGGNNGKAKISVANGQMPYTYLWNDPIAQTSDSVTNLLPGVYHVTVTDNIGCIAGHNITITNPAPIILATSTTPSACGSFTGTATVGVTSGGTSPYNYLWTNGGTNAATTGLHFGLYSVTVTDSHGCSKSTNVSISEANTATITLNSVTNISCNGSAGGALNINVTGGVAPFAYTWSNGATTQDLTGLSAGAYSVIVTDAGSCSASFNGIVSQVDSLSVTTNVVTVPTCGNPDGSASASVTGGTSPYTYLWDSGTNSTTPIISGLYVGTYTVTVTDALGCNTTKEVSLSNSNAPVITEVVTDVSCFGGTNGAIDVSVNGGTSPYLYTWSVPSPQTNHQDLTGLVSGNYILFVNDAQGCTAVRIYTITQPAVLTVSVTNTGTTCNHNDGIAVATPVGGNTSYSYLWTGSGQTGQTASGLAVGSYTVTVTDNKACIATASTSIAQITQKPSICMVTVDELSIHNIIYWDKTPYTSVDSFIVYREVSTNVYKRIGAVDYDSLSEFVDVSTNVGPANGDPNIGAYRYKIQIRDLCGDLSAMSLYHNTIYIAGPDNNGNFDWNLPYAIEGGDPNVANYRLYCDTLNSNWFEVGAVAGTQANVADPDYLSHSIYPQTQWYVQTDWTTVCTPTRAAINTSRSNIKHPNIITGVLPIVGIDNTFAIYPNPAKDNVTIELSSLGKNAQLKIVNVLGQTVFNETLIATSGKIVKKINTGNFVKGVYLVVVETGTTKVLKKLVIN